MKMDGGWGTSTSSVFEDMPPHRGKGNLPTGGNELFCDGSVSWVKFQNMYYLHTWNTGGSRIAYFYQNPTDFDSNLTQLLNLLVAKP
jgi:hypothetical protein